MTRVYFFLIIFLITSCRMSVEKKLVSLADGDPLAKAYAITKTISREHEKEDVFKKIAIEYARQMNFDFTYFFIDKIHNYNNRVEVYLEIYSAHLESGNKKKADLALSRALNMAKDIDGRSDPQSSVYNPSGTKDYIWRKTAEIYLKRNDFQNAKMAIKNGFWQDEISIYLSIADQYIKNNQKQEALQILAEALDKSMPYYPDGLTRIADRYLLLGEKSNIRNILDSAYLEAVKSVDPDERSDIQGEGMQSLVDIAVLYIKTGNNKKASMIFKRINNDKLGDKDYFLGDFITKLVEEKKYKEAERFLKFIDSDHYRAIAAGELSAGFYFSGAKKKAEKLFQESVKYAEKLNPSETAEIICEIATRYANQNNKSEKIEMLLDMVSKKINQINKDDKDNVLRDMGILYTKSGDAKKATDMLVSIKNESVKSEALKQLAVFYSQHKNVKQSFETIRKIPLAYYRALSLVEILPYCRENGKKIKKYIHAL
ncbi:MAG: hypothetical protein HY958_06745 [Bacteroidia bacterium]|nr:hypothetical protein [Bacteroidia bacterium]